MAASGRAAWTAPLAICCLLSILFLIAATIIIALIPVYLAAKNIQVNRNQGRGNVRAGFASNINAAQLGAVTNPSQLSTQILGRAGLSTTDNSISNPSFLRAQSTARKRRQSTNTNGQVTCEKATSLTGDIFLAPVDFNYPLFCFTSSCQSSYRASLADALRNNYQTYTVTVAFAQTTQNVNLIFCGIFTGDSSDCTTQTRTLGYAMDTLNNIYTFNPANLALSFLANINCTKTAYLFSIAVQRTGTLWATFDDGSLFRYNLASGVCSSTAFGANQTSLIPFTMTFVKNPTDAGEVLYVSSQNVSQSALGKLDLSTLRITPFGNFNNSASFTSLSSAGDSGLYTLLQPANYTFAEISKSTGLFLSQTPLNLNSTNSQLVAYALAAYGNVFYFFAGTYNGTTLYTIDRVSGALTNVGTYNTTILGATISSCYGT